MRRIDASILLALALSAVPAGAAPESEFVGWITDTECGPNHAPMIAKGGMGTDDAECTRRCVAKGATYGFVDIERRRFYQLDEQDAPARLAGRRARIEGRMEGDTVYVRSIVAAGEP
jgi:hypothetical protein